MDDDLMMIPNLTHSNHVNIHQMSQAMPPPFNKITNLEPKARPPSTLVPREFSRTSEPNKSKYAKHQEWTPASYASPHDPS